VTDGKALVNRAVQAGVDFVILGPETAIAAGVLAAGRRPARVGVGPAAAHRGPAPLVGTDVADQGHETAARVVGLVERVAVALDDGEDLVAVAAADGHDEPAAVGELARLNRWRAASHPG